MGIPGGGARLWSWKDGRIPERKRNLSSSLSFCRGVEKMVKDRNLNLRRLRQKPAIRELVREVRVSVDQLIQPLFVVEGLNERESIPGLTGTFRETSESILKTVENDLEAGVRKFILF